MHGGLWIPAAFLLSDEIAERDDWFAAYLWMQAEAVRTREWKGGKLARDELPLSVREAAREWSWTHKQARYFLDRLEERGLIEWPEGKPPGGRGPSTTPVRLLDPWWRSDPERGTQSRPARGSPLAREADDRGTQRSSDNGPPQGAGAHKVDARGTQSPASQNGPGAHKEEQGELLPNMGKRDPEAEAKAAAEEAQRVPQVHQLMELLQRVGLPGVDLTGRLYGKQAAVIKRLLEDLSPYDVQCGILGMRELYPWSEEDEPFDAFALSKHATKAVSKGRERLERRRKGARAAEARERAEQRSEERREEENRRYREWIEEWRESWEEAPEERREEIREVVRSEFRYLPERKEKTARARREAAMETRAIELYARGKGNAPPYANRPATPVTRGGGAG